MIDPAYDAQHSLLVRSAAQRRIERASSRSNEQAAERESESTTEDTRKTARQLPNVAGECSCAAASIHALAGETDAEHERTRGAQQPERPLVLANRRARSPPPTPLRSYSFQRSSRSNTRSRVRRASSGTSHGHHTALQSGWSSTWLPMRQSKWQWRRH